MLIEAAPREVAPSSPAYALRGVIAKTVRTSARPGFVNLFKPTSHPKALLFEPARFMPFKHCSGME
jgi:hypothetical protein